MNKTRGFITIATGKEEYYILAKNLLHSYRYFCKEQLPFAILADRENEYTKEFDDVIIFKNGATNSYLDKLSLGEYLPYDENIFIDSDCLAYGDLNVIFDCFENSDDFSCFGRVLPLDDKTRWFEYENLGDLKDKISFVVGLHGGIYYMRKGEFTTKIFEDAKRFIPDYPKYKFKGKFDTPGDEPLVALSMAVNGCHPIPFRQDILCCYWEHVDNIDLDIRQEKAYVKKWNEKVKLVHWGTRYTRNLLYKEQVAILNILESGDKDIDAQYKKCKRHFGRKILLNKYKNFVVRVKNRLLRLIRLN